MSEVYTLCHPTPNGKGSAVRISVRPADLGISGGLKIVIAEQIKPVKVEMHQADMFAWPTSFAFNLDVVEVSQIIQVLRGMCGSVWEGKGFFHRSMARNLNVKFRHVIKPVCGYELVVHSKYSDGREFDYSFTFTFNEALILMLAIEGAVPKMVFG